MHRVQRRSPAHPGVEVPAAGRDLDVEVAESPHGDVELRIPRCCIPVEHDGDVRPVLVGDEPVHDRAAADLLLAVAGEAHVHRQLTRLGEQFRRLHQPEELPLVVGDPPRVEPSVAAAELERLRLPELERVRPAGRRSARSRGPSARAPAPWTPTSPTTSGRPCQSITSAVPPARRIRSRTQAAAASTSVACAGSALIDGIAISSRELLLQALRRRRHPAADSRCRPPRGSVQRPGHAPRSGPGGRCCSRRAPLAHRRAAYPRAPAQRAVDDARGSEPARVEAKLTMEAFALPRSTSERLRDVADVRRLGERAASSGSGARSAGCARASR